MGAFLKEITSDIQLVSVLALPLEPSVRGGVLHSSAPIQAGKGVCPGVLQSLRKHGGGSCPEKTVTNLSTVG